MSPFQERHQPTHAAQPADALHFAPDDGPIAAPFDGEVGPPFDFTGTWMEPPGLWNYQIASQGTIDQGLIGQATMPPFDAGGEFFDWTSNYTIDETLGFGFGSASQNALSLALDEQVMVPPFNAEWSPFGSNPWMDRPMGLSDVEVASSAVLPLGQAPVTLDGAPSHLQDASFHGFDPADWTDEDAGMPYALRGFTDHVR
jgi:hypothetical protein